MPSPWVLRGVGLQGYFRQTNPDGGYWARPTQSAVIHVTDDEARRTVVDLDLCLDCHGFLEGHGGEDVNDPQICAFCHNPSLSSGGRTLDAAGLPQATIDAVGSDPLLFPEDTNNLRDMIHGIHGSGVRSIEYELVGPGSGGLYSNWADVTFPQNDGTQNCLACHLGGTFDAELPEGTLPTTVVTTDGAGATAADISAARDTVPNGTDLANSPTASACYMCHANDAAEAHIEQNGGIIQEARASAELQ